MRFNGTSSYLSAASDIRSSSVFAQMCLASEAGKMDTVQSYPEDSSSKASLQQTTIKPEIKGETADAAAGPPSSDSAPLSSASSTSTDTVPPQLRVQNTCVKNKSRKREGTQSHDKSDETACSAKKMISQCQHAESNTESVPAAIEKGAKLTLKDAEEKPKKKLQRSSGSTNSALPKKKNKPKVAETEKETEDRSAPNASSGVMVKEESEAHSPKTDKEEPRVETPDHQSGVAEQHRPPRSPSPLQPKEDNHGKEACESSVENCGSRKSERRCKGALYKTLVSEGMLTSLRANIDRGAYLINDGVRPSEGS